MSDEICPVSGETVNEERINHFTHLLGLILSVIGLGFLLKISSFQKDILMSMGVIIYGITLVLLYAASTFYHGCTKNKELKRILRIVDHSCIFLLIAGTYTPFMMGPLKNVGGWTLLFIEWSIALIGILVKVYVVHRFRIISTFAYLAMGWLVIFSWPMLLEKLSTTAIICLVIGGVLYSFGTIFYLWKSLPHSHAIWHLFVLGGSIAHYFAVLEVV